MARNKKKPKGLGDVVEMFTETTGIKAVVKLVNGEDCVDCQERKDRWNRKYPNLRNARKFTKEESMSWVLFEEDRNNFLNKKGSLEINHILFVCKLFSDVLSLPYWKPSCFACRGTGQSIKVMIDKLDIVYNTYEE